MNAQLITGSHVDVAGGEHKATSNFLIVFAAGKDDIDDSRAKKVAGHVKSWGTEERSDILDRLAIEYPIITQKIRSLL